MYKMLSKTKNRLIAILILIIIILIIVLARNKIEDAGITVAITNISFLSPQTVEVTITGTMPSNITAKNLYITSFNVSSSSISSPSGTDITTTSGTSLISSAFGQNVPLSISSSSNTVITSLTVPKYFTENQITTLTLSGNGNALIK
jgi:hypothetical protein